MVNLHTLDAPGSVTVQGKRYRLLEDQRMGVAKATALNWAATLRRGGNLARVAQYSGKWYVYYRQR
jgi:hypothetical protein